MNWSRINPSLRFRFYIWKFKKRAGREPSLDQMTAMVMEAYRDRMIRGIMTPSGVWKFCVEERRKNEN